ncbi:LysR family transcriptional regulator [Holophaga foetida]|uniref:LysR family transcriptional regulator n=1 Tax=Holophaga foetida TaxID=35839 RepID=UPI0002471C7E|nr:LysR family transcriptional regulator [Holophaga foetida]
MDIRQVKCFLAVAEHLNFTKAGNQLFLTHSAVGYQIAALERDIGTKLFDRNSHAVRLTAAGEYFQPRIRRILADYQEAIEKTRQVGIGISGRVRLGFLGGLEEKFLPLFIKRFRKAHPEVEVQPSHYPLASIQENLANGGLDIVFTHTSTIRELAGVSFEPLFEAPLGIVVTRDHPKAAKKRLKLMDLKNEPFVQLSTEIATSIVESDNRLFSGAGFTPTVVQLAGDFGALFMLVESGVGVTILPRYKVNLSQHPNLRFIPLQDPDARIEGCVAWKTRTDNPVVPVFLRALGVRFK